MSLKFECSFASHPKSIYWSHKNIQTPNNVSKSSGHKFWFNCNECGHEFETRLDSIQKGGWCSYCCKPGRKLCTDESCKLCFEKSFASHEKSKHWSRNNSISPRQAFKVSAKIYLFDCDVCGHEFESILHLITNGGWCKYCSGHAICSSESCQRCFEKSFASHCKSQCLSKRYNYEPRIIMKGCNDKFVFECEECKHEFESNINNVVKGSWCPYCSTPCKKLCDKTGCTTCFTNSFASHKRSESWSTINNIQPRDCIKSSGEKYAFVCKECNHEFYCALNHVNSGKWCPYCGNNKICSQSNCTYCFQRSFASVPQSSSWSPKNNLNPRDVFAKTSQKFIFDCAKCKAEFQASLSHVTNGTWCPSCKNKTEQKLFEWLKTRYSTKPQPRYEWCKNPETSRYLPFDFEIESNIIIELDGRQHFEQVAKWSSPEFQKERDIFKMKRAQENGKHVIRLYQEDVWNDANEWEKTLIVIIENIKMKTEPTIQYVGDVNRYIHLQIT
jgi:hypothetical protein